MPPKKQPRTDPEEISAAIEKDRADKAKRRKNDNYRQRVAEQMAAGGGADFAINLASQRNPAHGDPMPRQGVVRIHPITGRLVQMGGINMQTGHINKMPAHLRAGPYVGGGGGAWYQNRQQRAWLDDTGADLSNIDGAGLAWNPNEIPLDFRDDFNDILEGAQDARTWDTLDLAPSAGPPLGPIRRAVLDRMGPTAQAQTTAFLAQRAAVGPPVYHGISSDSETESDPEFNLLPRDVRRSLSRTAERLQAGSHAAGGGAVRQSSRARAPPRSHSDYYL